MTKTINELIEEFGDPPFTREDYEREKLKLLVEFRKQYALNNADEIDEAIRTYRLPCANRLVEAWIALAAVEQHLD